MNLVRDKETGKSRGFAFLKYEDQRSTDLAVDNLGGAVVMNRTLKVDHTRYKRKEDEPDQGIDLTTTEPVEEIDDAVHEQLDNQKDKRVLKEEHELVALIRDHDDDDPMKGFLIQKKKDEIARALAESANGRSSEKPASRHHRHRSHHTSEGRKHHDEKHMSSKHRRSRNTSRHRS